MLLEPYFAVKLLHLLLFVYWLGGDVGVFHAARYVRKRELTVEARRTALAIAVWVDQIPRYCLVLMLPVGYSLARESGFVATSDGWMTAVWALAVVWLWLVWAVHRYHGTPHGARLRRFDLTWRICLVPGLLWDASQGWRGTGHLLSDWLALKVAVYALIIFCGIMIRVYSRPRLEALQQLFAQGTSPQVEQTIDSSFAKTRPFVLAIWALLVLAAYVGITKPSL
jgi:hypothetical protein